MSEDRYEEFWAWLEARDYRFHRKVTDSEGETCEFVFGRKLVRQGFEEGWGRKDE